jgi:glycosyltransferase involved in cell wall biosynthesis
MKISIITAVYNRESSIEKAIRSLQYQTFNNYEHIIIDGNSADGTLSIINRLKSVQTIVLSEKDSGIYDALNKGLTMATGDIVGFLHSDDIFADCNVLQDINEAFKNEKIDCVYGDLEYVSQVNQNKVIRYWSAGNLPAFKFNFGWIPPHPTLFLRRKLIIKLGGFDQQYQISADYDAMTRYIHLGNATTYYLNRVLVKMSMGGESNKSFERLWRKSREDFSIIRRHRLGFIWGLDTLVFKNIRKLSQFITAKNK